MHTAAHAGHEATAACVPPRRPGGVRRRAPRRPPAAAPADPPGQAAHRQAGGGGGVRGWVGGRCFPAELCARLRRAACSCPASQPRRDACSLSEDCRMVSLLLPCLQAWSSLAARATSRARTCRCCCATARRAPPAAAAAGRVRRPAPCRLSRAARTAGIRSAAVHIIRCLAGAAHLGGDHVCAVLGRSAGAGGRPQGRRRLCRLRRCSAGRCRSGS